MAIDRKKKQEKTLPYRLILGQIPDTTQKDARAYARGLVERYFTAVKNSYVNIRKYKGGFYYEVHEGGPGESLLDWVLKQLDAPVEEAGSTESETPEAAPEGSSGQSDKDAEPVIDTSREVLIRTGECGVIIARDDQGVLYTVEVPQESMEGMEFAEAVEFGKKITPFDDSGTRFLYVSTVFMALGILMAAMGGVVSHTAMPKLSALQGLPDQTLIKVDLLPDKQLEKLMAEDTEHQGHAVGALKFEGNKWFIDWIAPPGSQIAADQKKAEPVPEETESAPGETGDSAESPPLDREE